MDDELERMIMDRNDAENELYFVEQEIEDLERLYPDSFEDMDEWDKLYHEANEIQNHISYLNSCIDSYEEYGEI